MFQIDEGVELFEETMAKMQEANSENQREKFQDDLKKEIKKLQRLRDQIKGWQNSSDIKDKEKLTHYRKVIEQRMEQFKDIERENKTKPHSKQGLSAEEKLDPREKEKADTIEWLQVCAFMHFFRPPSTFRLLVRVFLVFIRDMIAFILQTFELLIKFSLF